MLELGSTWNDVGGLAISIATGEMREEKGALEKIISVWVSLSCPGENHRCYSLAATQPLLAFI